MIFYLRPPSTYLAQFILYKQPVAHIITLEINGMVKIYYLDWGKGVGACLDSRSKILGLSQDLGSRPKTSRSRDFQIFDKENYHPRTCQEFGSQDLGTLSKIRTEENKEK